MTTSSRNWFASARKFALAGAATLLLAACTGGSDNTGPEGPTGPVGPPGGGVPPGAVASATSLQTRINRAVVGQDGRPVVDVFIADQTGNPVTGLPAGNIRFVMARLEPAVNGRSSTWHALTRRVEAFPGTPAPTPTNRVTGTGPTNQGYTETGSTGTWVDNRDGTYRYTFAYNASNDAGITYDPSLPHRVGLEIRTAPNVTAENLPANNAIYTFVPATDTKLEQSGREIVDNDTCNACHDNLVFHGGARFDLQYCSMCHDSYSFDAQSGNPLDLKVMIHKIHSGETLPSVEAGGFYGIFGFGNVFTDFSELVYPQDTRNCTTCHQETDTDTPQASNWRLTVNRETCSSCHDTVNFTTGANHGGGVAATDDTCAACHGPTAQLGNLRVELAHQIPEQLAAAKFKYEVLAVSNTAPGEFPKVTIRVVDPTNGNAPYDIRAVNGPFQNPSASLRVDVAFSTQPDFTNTGSGSAPTATTGTPAQPISIDFKANGVADPAFAGAFSATSAVAIPATVTGSGSALLEGRPAIDVNGDGTRETLQVTAAGRTFAITDTTPVPYRQIVDITKCNDCHQVLSLHGNNRTGNAELCATCHNPNATDINRRVAGSSCESVTGTLDDQTIDLKVMIHAIHAGSLAGFKVCGFGNSGYDFSTVRYPGRLNNCEGCHLPDTYYPPNSATALATTIDAGDRSTPLGDIAISPGAAVCSSCHTDGEARLHMEINGGSFNAVKDANSRTPGAPLETCGVCHGKGTGPADVAIAHGVGQFLFND